MLSFVNGDMFEDVYDIRVNTVNCVGVMGAGVALAFKFRYPEMFRAYRRACEEGRIRPGEIDVWRTLTEWVINFPTKRHWRNKARYEDIESGLNSLHDYLKGQGSVRVALPALGCGHGGLEWTRVAAMIDAKLRDLDADVYVFEPSDSWAAGENVKEAQRIRGAAGGLEWKTADNLDALLPRRLRDAGVDRATVMGNAGLLGLPTIAVQYSTEPDEREEASALACIEALAAPSVRISLPFGDRIGHGLAAAALGRGAAVVLWAAQGSARIHLAVKFHDNVREGRLALATLAAPNEQWTRRNAERVAALQTSVATAVLLTGGRPIGLQRAWHGLPVFYLWYSGQDDGVLGELRAMGAQRIGRDRQTGVPNVSPILAVLAAANETADDSSERQPAELPSSAEPSQKLPRD